MTSIVIFRDKCVLKNYHFYTALKVWQSLCSLYCVYIQLSGLKLIDNCSSIIE